MRLLGENETIPPMTPPRPKVRIVTEPDGRTTTTIFID